MISRKVTKDIKDTLESMLTVNDSTNDGFIIRPYMEATETNDGMYLITVKYDMKANAPMETISRVYKYCQRTEEAIDRLIDYKL